VFTGGELLQRECRQAIASAFDAKVYDIYGTSETKEIAWECPAGGLHVNADVIHLEVLDERGRPLPAGVEGELVATPLVNRAMPLLRYRTGDRGSLLSGSCSCGIAQPLLGGVSGREVDVLVLAGGRRISPYALTCALERIDGIHRYQVNQLDERRLKVHAIARPAAERAAITSHIRSALRAEVAPFVEAEVEFVDRLPTGPGAKFRVVQSRRALPSYAPNTVEHA
jgi:phenylacetate-CoA ligase